MGYDAGVKCQLNPGRDDPAKRKAEAAALIVGAGQDRTPTGFVRVDTDKGAYVVPTY
jgi:hypothetical protein